MNGEFWSLVKSDLIRHRPIVSIKTFCSALIKDYDFRLVFLLRLHQRFMNTFIIGSLVEGAKSIYENSRLTYVGSHIPIGKSFSVGHCFSTIVEAEKIGDYVTVMQQVTIGRSIGGNRAGIPSIGNNVVIASGSKVIGKLKIGNNVFVGANSVIVKDVPDNAVVVGNPARIINYEGKKYVYAWTRRILKCED